MENTIFLQQKSEPHYVSLICYKHIQKTGYIEGILDPAATIGKCYPWLIQKLTIESTATSENESRDIPEYLVKNQTDSSWNLFIRGDGRGWNVATAHDKSNELFYLFIYITDGNSDQSTQLLYLLVIDGISESYQVNLVIDSFFGGDLFYIYDKMATDAEAYLA